MKSVASLKSSSSSQVRKQSSKSREHPSQIVELTTENLRMLGKSSLARTSSVAARSDIGIGPVGQLATATAATAHAGALRAHLVPDGWQAAVRRNFKAAHVEKNIRQARLNRRTDQLRKELTEASAGA